jgi:RHS repeat-associated protein
MSHTANTATRSFTHDARGNLIAETRPGTPSPTNVSASYDGYGRLTGHTQSGAAALAFSYNGLDDRVSQSEGADVQRFVYDSMGRIVGEYATSPSAIRGEYIYLHPDGANDNASPHGGDDGLGGYGLLTIMTPDASAGGAITAHYPHSNHLGAPLFSTDASGAVVTPGAYAQPVFPGQLRTRADLYYNRHRDYDPTTGRYIQADPLGLDGDANPYLYANGNPMRYVDPEGLEIANLFPETQPKMRQAAEEAYKKLPKSEQDSGYHVYGHGGPLTQCVYTDRYCMNAEKFSNWLLLNKGSKYKLNQNIYLHSCYTGSLDNGFAKRLSGFMQVAVYAPTSYVWYDPKKGILAIGDELPWPMDSLRNPFSPGKMRRFDP